MEYQHCTMMESIYYDISHPAAYGGMRRLKKAAGGSTKTVANFLNKQGVYRMFRSPKTKFKRARIIVDSMGVQFQADLCDFQKLGTHNSGYKWILLVVDAFSRYVKCQPLKDKSGLKVAAGLRKIFNDLKDENRLAPRAQISTDLGNEFYNKLVQEVLNEYGVSHFALRAPIKCSLAEISIRYIAGKLYKFMMHKQTKRWIDALQPAVQAKNNRKNIKTAGFSPSEINFVNQKTVRTVLYPKVETAKYTLNVDDRVQIVKTRLPFAKSYHGYYSQNTYRIVKRHQLTVPRYSLIDEYDEEPIAGSWYADELYKL